MNPGVVRTKGGKNQKRIIEKTHELYSFGVDVLIEETAKNILDHEEDFEVLTVLLQTTIPLNKVYKSYKYNIVLEQSDRIAKALTNHLKSIRRRKTVKKSKLQDEYKTEKIKELKKLPKAYLARKLVKLLPEKDLENFIRYVQRKEEEKRLNRGDFSPDVSNI